MKIKPFLGAMASTLTLSTNSYAETEILWWRAFTGRLDELLAVQIEELNANQSEFMVVGSHTGNCTETLNADIAAFRAGEQPHILMVFEVGTATMMAAKGAISSVYEVMVEAGTTFDSDAYMGAVKGYYTTTESAMLSLPYNSSTPVLCVNSDAFEGAPGPEHGP